MSECFIGCDWGSSSLRIRLIDYTDLRVVAEISSADGIAVTHGRWKQSGAAREHFYQSVLADHFASMEKSAGVSLAGTAVVVSGMASSSIGMLELPYAILPFSTTAGGLVCRTMPASTVFPFPMLVVSGARSDNDVMRGEETQLIGAVNGATAGQQLFILPGTHSKHLVINNGNVVNVKTFMTGEFFALLTEKSVLANSVSVGGNFDDPANTNAFEEGVREAAARDLLHSAFKIRTRQLLAAASATENYFYLTGLLIGTELASVIGFPPNSTTIVADPPLQNFYLTASRLLGAGDAHCISAGKATIAGQHRLYQLYSKQLRNPVI